MDPLESIAADGAQLAVVPAPSSPLGFLGGAWQRLVSQSPRSEVDLSADAFALLINRGLDGRSGGAASPAKLGEGVMDCAYALMGDGGFSGASPLARLFSGVVGFFARFKRSAKPQVETTGELRVG